MIVIDNEIWLDDPVVLWKYDKVEVCNGVLHCKDVILNPDFKVEGGEVSCRDLYVNGERFTGSTLDNFAIRLHTLEECGYQ